MANIIAQGYNSTITKVSSTQVRKKVDINENREIPNIIELEILHKYCHPYLVPGYGCSLKNQSLEMVIPYADHQDLAALTELPVSETELLTFFYQTALGLACLHHAGILHLDIKPDNILIFRQGDEMFARLGDYGLAMYEPIELSTQRIGGSVCYLAPEVLYDLMENKRMQSEGLGEKHINLSKDIDIWALGFSFFLIFSKLYDFCEDGKRNLLPVRKLYNKIKYYFHQDRKDAFIGSVIANQQIRDLVSRILIVDRVRISIDEIVHSLEVILNKSPYPIVFLDNTQQQECPPEFQQSLTTYLDRLKTIPNIEVWKLVFHNKTSIYLSRLITLSQKHPYLPLVCLYMIISSYGFSITVPEYIEEIGEKISPHKFVEELGFIIENMYGSPKILTRKLSEKLFMYR